MTLPGTPTRVDYPAGALAGTATVLHVAPAADDLVAVVTDATSFHPVDAAWPDQPADRGVLRANGRELPIVDAVGAAPAGAERPLAAAVPVRQGTEGWTFLVAHLVDAADAPSEGDEVEIAADAELRAALSAGHTACHLASLALNRALAGRWSKEPREDALGAPDFDGTAIQSSRIEANGSVDRYRLNKSLRRAGFDTASLDEASLPALAAEIEATLAEWVAADAAVRIEAEGPTLTDRRSWVCELPDGTARIPCGGTHAQSTGALGGLDVQLELGDDAGTPVLVMTTRATPRS